MINFEWDTAKANSNKKKHGVSFEEAQSVFYDEFAVQFFDEVSSAPALHPHDLYRLHQASVPQRKEP
jgi:uncharacterized DUF497 family protein